MDKRLTFCGYNLSEDMREELRSKLKDIDLASVDIITSNVKQDETEPIIGISPSDLFVLIDQLGQKNQEIQELETKLDLSLRRVTQLKKTSQHADTAKNNFFANMNHEIRTPLNAIIGMTDLLMDTELNSEQMEYTESVKTASKSLHYFVNELLPEEFVCDVFGFPEQNIS